MAARAAAGSLTAEQQAAVSGREASIVLSSGAGCGKTFVLTERYLGHLRDDGAEVGQIVAITFTDRAARQMRDRIRRAIVKELRTCADAGADRWAQHLDDLETAPISTIHAFCAALLRQHAVAVGLDPQFEVLEEFLAANLEAEALTACLQELLISQSQPGDDLKDLILLYGWRPTVAAVQNLMRAWDEAKWRAWLQTPAERLAAGWHERSRADLLPRYADWVAKANIKIAHCLTLLRTTPCHGPETRARVEKILTATPRLAEADDLAAAIAELTETAKVGRERGKAWPSEEIYEMIKDAFADYRDELPRRFALLCQPDEDLTAAAQTGQRFLRVAAEAVRAYQQRKRRVGAVDFQDLLVLARDLVRDRPDVRERLQKRYRFLLVDELQDTDPVQMELLDLLAGAGLTTGKLFGVGDYKQSIYRFRGAVAELFQELRERIPLAGRLPLTRNFRSQPAILHFVNALLGGGVGPGQIGLPNYEKLVPHLEQVNPGPCVEFLWSQRPGKMYANEARAIEADRIARRIAAMIGKEVLVLDRRPKGSGKPRPVRAGDIVLLFRAMSNVALFEQALRDHGLDYYLVGGRAFFAQQEIYDLLNLLRALENPQDAVSLAGALRSPFCCLSDEALFVLARHREGLWAGLGDPVTRERLPTDQRDAAERACRWLQKWRAAKDRQPIALLLGEVLADSGYDAALLFEHLGERKLANLWKLIDLARTFDRSGQFGLADFIQQLSEMVRTQPREEQAATQPESADLIKLMTIHQAKGLEFPVVFLPDCSWTGGGPHIGVAHWDANLGCVVRPPPDEQEEAPFSDQAWQLWRASEDIQDFEEDLRTLYVACTRAMDYLVLSAALPEPFRPCNAWTLALASRFNIKTGECLDTTLDPKEQPRVRVISEAPTACAPRKKETKESSLDWIEAASRATEPIRPRWTGRQVIPVAWLASGGRESAEGALSSGDSRPPLADRAGMLRAILGRWDCRQRDGWRAALQATGAAGDNLEPLLARFAKSTLVEEMAAAIVCHRNLEFLVVPPDKEKSSEQPLLHGVIDYLWQDAEGWHLLAFGGLEGDAVGPEAALPRHLVTWVWAVHEQLQVWPRSLTLHSFADGSSQRWVGAALRPPAAAAAVRAALATWSGQLPS